MKHVKLFEDFKISELSHNKIIDDITDKLKEKTINNSGKFGFDITTPSRNSIYWRDVHENPKWSLSYSTNPANKNIFWVDIDKKKFRVEGLEMLLKLINLEGVISERSDFYSNSINDINNLVIFSKRDLGL